MNFSRTDIMDFAERHGPYIVKDDEIKFKLCPYCHGGDHRDKDTAAMNIETGAFNCKRGSCGRAVSLWQACKDLGDPLPRSEVDTAYSRPSRHYKPPETPTTDITAVAQEYFTLRKISMETAATYKVKCDKDGNIVFQYFLNGNVVFNKFRKPGKIPHGQRKMWREKDTMPVLYGMDLCDTKYPLCIFEGEFDALSGHEAGIPNCVSVPSGAADMTWIDNCWDWLKQYKAIYLYGDSDEPGQEMVNKLAAKFNGDFRVFIVKHEGKDANELLFRQGKQAVKAAFDSAKELPVNGLLNLADVRPLDVKNIQSAASGIKPLDKKMGGFLFGEVTVLTGKRGEGKSTLAGQILLEVINQGKSVCAYSGELRADRFQYWVNLQAAGANNITNYYDDLKERDVFYIEKPMLEKIRSWYDGKFWLYDNSIAQSNEAENILKVFSYAVKRYDCKFFLVDNLMTCRYATSNDKDFYRMQSNLVGAFVEFAKRYNVHVLIVAHPRKTPNSLTADDISGSGDVANRADNVLSLKRLSENEREQQEIDCMLTILKNRSEGAEGKIGLDYDNVSRRLFVPSEGQHSYGWQNLPTWVDTDDVEILPY